MERRDFIKSTCTLSACISTGLIVGMLGGCSPIPVYKTTINNNKISIPISVFNKGNLQLIIPEGYGNKIAVRKKENEEVYSAILLRCTHADNPLSVTGDSFTCQLHGSKFNQDGVVLKGPAEKSLTILKTSRQDESLIIEL